MGLPLRRSLPLQELYFMNNYDDYSILISTSRRDLGVRQIVNRLQGKENISETDFYQCLETSYI